MRQTTLTRQLTLDKAHRMNGVDTLVQLLQNEEELAFHAVIPHGNVLKCISELLMRCAPHVSLTIQSQGLVFLACDPTGGRLIHITLMSGDMRGFSYSRSASMRFMLETNSLHAVFNQLKRRDTVVLYATVSGQFGSLVDYSGRQDHTKHSTISSHQMTQVLDYNIPTGYTSPGVTVPSNILQRILREYKNLSKRIIVTGNDRYIHIQTDARVSLHRSDNLFGTLDPKEDDVSVELSINTLARILKVTQFHPWIEIMCQAGQPVRLKTQLGVQGSFADVYIQPDTVGGPSSG
jgi:hypothetical protein